MCLDAPARRPAPQLPVLMLVGGGHAHIQVILNLRGSGARCVLISDSATAAYSGMLPAVVAGLVREDRAHVDLRALCKHAGFRFVQGRVVGLNAGKKELAFSVGGNGGCKMRFDVLSINVGSRTVSIPTAGSGVPSGDCYEKIERSGSFRPFVVETRPILNLMTSVRVFEEDVSRHGAGRKTGPVKIVVVGGGAAGIELTLALESRFARTIQNAHVTLVSGGDSFATFFGRAAGLAVVAELQKRDVNLRLATTAVSVDANAGLLHLDKGPDLNFDLLVVATGAAPHAWLAQGTDLDVDDRGWLKVERTLQCAGFANVFAAGDCVTFGEAYGKDFPPKAGVYAVREGPILTHNLEMALAQSPVRPEELRQFAPQASFLSLLSAGDGRGIGSKYGIVFKGTWVYRLKNYIDESWQERFRVMGKKATCRSRGKPLENRDGFRGSPLEGALILQAAEDVQTDDSFEEQLAVLDRMDKDREFRESLSVFVKREL